MVSRAAGPLARWPSDRPLIVSHRGNAEGARENTLAGVRKALDSGADGIEVDVRATRDGAPVLHHDRRLDGTPVASATYDELRAQAVDHGFELARVGEVLEAVDGQALVNLELKDPAAVDAVLDRVDRTTPGPILVTAFDPDVARAVPDDDPRLSGGLILGPGRLHRLLFSLRRTRRLRSWLDGADPDVLVAHRFFLRWGLASSVLGLDRPVVTWTVNGQRRLRASLSHPLLDGVITDRPSLARRLRDLLRGFALGGGEPTPST